MFNVTRIYPAPACIARGHYTKEEVLVVLKPMFFEKCYLCERDEIQDVEVEHFVPHEGDDALKYSWENLFYSCSRCNSIKSNRHVNLLDCTDGALDVGSLISCKMPSAPSDRVMVGTTSQNPTQEMINTARLLDECFNLENTALRGISREALMEQLWDHYTDLLNARRVLRNKKSPEVDKIRAEQTISAMLTVKHPFSIFWRYYYLGDTFLVNTYSHLRVGF